MKQLYSILALLTASSCYAQMQHADITHYLFPAFTQGVVLMKSGKINSTSLNYNSLTEEMVFEKDGGKLAISEEEQALVDSVFIEERKFIVLNDRFVEVVHHDGNWNLYVEHKCKVRKPGQPVGYGGTSHTSSVTTYSRISTPGIVYDLALPEGYETKPFAYYWVQKKGEAERIVNMKQLKRSYKDKQQKYKAYLKAHAVDFNDQESIIRLIEYLETS